MFLFQDNKKEVTPTLLLRTEMDPGALQWSFVIMTQGTLNCKNLICPVFCLFYPQSNQDLRGINK